MKNGKINKKTAFALYLFFLLELIVFSIFTKSNNLVLALLLTVFLPIALLLLYYSMV